jgi:hypothetical protein
MTTFNTPSQPNPAIDFTAGNTLSFWMRAVVALPTNFWIGPSGGNWNDPANWNSGDVPDTQAETANLLAAASPTTINMDFPTLINGVTFDSAAPNGYTISGTETLTLGGQIGFQRSLNVVNGVHSITSPLELINAPSTPESGWTVTTTNAADQLTTSGVITLNNTGPMSINKNGAGLWETSRLESLNDPTFAPVILRVNGGTARLLAGGGTTRVYGITMAGGVAPTTRFDINGNAVVVDYAPPVPGPEAEPLDTLKAQIASAYAGGSWTGPGIGSTGANNSTHGVGYAEASALPSVPAVFGTVDADTVLIRLTRYGDANLDGIVNLADFNRLAANFGTGAEDTLLAQFRLDPTLGRSESSRFAVVLCGWVDVSCPREAGR